MSQPVAKRRRKPFVVGKADIKHGERRLVQVNGKIIGIFNLHGDYFALHNRCPHMGGNLCEGPVTGTTLPVNDTAFVYGKEGEIIRCAWHGWEFDIRNGRCLVDRRLRARSYQVTVDNGDLVIHI